MKAFQLKIAIKNSKPPIWRRIIVPAGITFSQLSMILNRAMGWSGYHLFSFEFYHLNLTIEEEADMWFDGVSDNVEASETYIREYLEENDWFTYVYDFGDHWKHRVTVEKVIEDYDYDYPQVMKYKGDCPMEDCGGISLYYYYLDVAKDPNHPDHKECVEWMEREGCPNTYDIDSVNQEMKRRFIYRWGKGEKRCQNKIYNDHFEGEFGLKATKNDKNKPRGQFSSEFREIGEKIQQLVDEIESYQTDVTITVFEELISGKEMFTTVFQDDLCNNTRMVLNNGDTPNEIEMMNQDKMLQRKKKSNTSKVISLDEVRKSRGI